MKQLESTFSTNRKQFPNDSLFSAENCRTNIIYNFKQGTLFKHGQKSFLSDEEDKKRLVSCQDEETWLKSIAYHESENYYSPKKLIEHEQSPNETILERSILQKFCPRRNPFPQKLKKQHKASQRFSSQPKSNQIKKGKAFHSFHKDSCYQSKLSALKLDSKMPIHKFKEDSLIGAFLSKLKEHKMERSFYDLSRCGVTHIEKHRLLKGFTISSKQRVGDFRRPSPTKQSQFRGTHYIPAFLLTFLQH